MEKMLPRIIFTIMVLTGLAWAQTLSDIERYRKQYEDYLRSMQQGQASLVLSEDQAIIGDIPSEFYVMKKEKEIKPDKKLKYFGYDFFTLRDSIPIWDNLPMPPSYRLGPGDEIIISLWGETQLRSSYTIGRDGMIYIERVGKISLADKSINQAKTYLEKQFQKVYETLKGSRPSTFMDVSLGQLKSINVTFVGEVKLPGIHPVHPFSTVLTSLIQAGGVDTTGSLRNIQIIRGDDDPEEVDLYAFLLSGETGKANMRLQDNDVIFIPPRSSSIEIDGAIKRPGIYESLPNESVADLVDYAGGLKAKAHHKMAIFRFDPELETSDSQNPANALYTHRDKAGEISIQDVNRIMAYSAPDYIKSVYVYGQVKNPGEYGFEKGMDVLSLIKLAGGLFDDTYYQTIYAKRAEIIRRNPESNFPKVIPINLAELKQGNKTQNIELHNWDIMLVRKNQNFTVSKQVQITGEVKIPGVYSLRRPQESLADLLGRAGGYTAKAFEDGVKLYRDSIQVAIDNFNVSLMDGDSVSVPEHPGVVHVIGEVYNPGYVQYDRGRGLNNYIEAAGGFTLEARKKYITIIYPNGDVKVKDSFIPPRVKEGSLIIVQKAEEKLPFDGTAFLKETASIAASMATIFFIIKSQSN